MSVFIGRDRKARRAYGFDEIALGANLLFDEKSIKAPKIPKALEPDDPRQLGFGFTASASSVVTRYLNNK